MYLAIDFGGTRTRAGWFSAELALLRRAEAPSQTEEPPEAVIARIIGLARSVVPTGEMPAAIGICGPGAQAYTGIILNARTLPGWERVPLAEPISAAFGGAPTFMENDANLAALAEYHFGAAQGCDPAVYLTVSTGIGGGAVIGGRLFTGWHGLAIEPGHIPFVMPDGRVLDLELLASGTAIGRLARERLAATDTPSTLRDLARVDGRAVGEAAQRGDALARALIEEAGRWLGLGLVTLAHLFNPQAIVLGGSVATLGDLILQPAREQLAAHLIDPAFNDPDLLRLAALGDDVCLTGAALHARARLQEARPAS
ncbi:MAG: ROK family protein [Anaerolineae bacterium]|nr:ROK family protein [Anaerolineae bacterium]